MNENLQELFRVQPLLDEVISLRTADVRKVLKSRYAYELKHLLQVDIAIPQTDLEMPNDKVLPPLTEAPKVRKLDEFLEEYKSNMEALKKL